MPNLFQENGLPRGTLKLIIPIGLVKEKENNEQAGCEIVNYCLRPYLSSNMQSR